MWWLAIAAAACLGGIVAAWAVWRRMLRQMAVEHDRSDRDVHSARTEVAQLRRCLNPLLADELVMQAANVVVINALRGLGSQETER